MAVAADGVSVTLTTGMPPVSVLIRVPPGGACEGGAVFSVSTVLLAPPQNPTIGLKRFDVTVDPRVCAGLDETHCACVGRVRACGVRGWVCPSLPRCTEISWVVVAGSTLGMVAAI